MRSPPQARLQRQLPPQPRPRSLLARTRERLRQAGLHARKGLGQHFLVDGTVMKQIVSAADLSPGDTVVEVGPGLGFMTEELAKQAGRVVAVEVDANLAALLKTTLAGYPNVTIVNADILAVNPASLLGPTESYKVVANLPYYIAAPVLRLFLEASHKPETIVVMVQKEVARQIRAVPPEISLLSIGVQLYGEPKIVRYVPSRAFHPPPDVDSAILRIKVYPRPAVEVDPATFFPLVRAGFSAARKQIVNSLANGLDLPKPEVLTVLESAGIDPRRRAETLFLEEWERLWRAYCVRREKA
jgi:16S rRNA (adenine1518-N6/adenine1519-N6)-dimethyltransferase